MHGQATTCRYEIRLTALPTKRLKGSLRCSDGENAFIADLPTWRRRNDCVAREQFQPDIGREVARKLAADRETRASCHQAAQPSGHSRVSADHFTLHRRWSPEAPAVTQTLKAATFYSDAATPICGTDPSGAQRRPWTSQQVSLLSAGMRRRN